jgi:hypothetical protein
MGEVDPDLVRAPGLEPAADQRGRRPKAPQTVTRVTAWRPRSAVDGLALPVGAVAVEPGGDAQHAAGLEACPPHAAQARVGLVGHAVAERQVARAIECASNCAASPWCAAVRLGHHEKPEVSLSIRCTMPGRFSPPMPERLPPKWCRSALTSVPPGLPGAGWTTMPAGLSRTIEVVVLEDDVEGDVLGERVDLGRLGRP